MGHKAEVALGAQIGAHLSIRMVVDEIVDFLAEKISIAESAGVDAESIVVDPGIGFGKTLEHNLKIGKEFLGFRSFGSAKNTFVVHF